MTRPGPEGDLSRIVGQVHNLQRLHGVAGQTDREYRAAIANYRNSLLTICGHPDLQNLLKNNRFVKSFNTPFPPIIGYSADWGMTSPGFVTLHDFYRLSHSQQGRYPYVVNLDIQKDRGGKFDFSLTFDTASKVYSVYGAPAVILPPDALRDARRKGNESAARIDADLNLDNTTKWQKRKRKYFYPSSVGRKGTGIFETLEFVKKLTLEDFTNHPEWLSIFESSLAVSLDRVHTQTISQIHEQQRKTEQFTVPPIDQVLADLRTHTRNYSRVDTRLAIQDAAETTLQSIPPLPPNVSEERVRAIFEEMYSELIADARAHRQAHIVYRDSPQLNAKISQIAQGDSTTETLLQRLLSNVQDPRIMADVVAELVTLIPGAQKIATILKVVNMLTEPKPDR